ncbi:MAG TPA: FoF1 ATP synthase subunit gamma [Clostridia bacterium]|jgi:F-type H+-transporting ATPase subunit gamma|nr:FoF1 ATP synthase subunit gamma [Clostridia bacterium]
MKEQELKRRIAGVKETVKITKAMQMIAASKMHKAQVMYDSAKYYLEKASASAAMLRTKSLASHPYFDRRESDKAAFFVLAGDKGLCGDYNHLILEKAYEEIRLRNVTQVFPVGFMANDFFRKKGYTRVKTYLNVVQEPLIEDAKLITEDIIVRYMNGEFDKVYIAYTDIVTPSLHKTVSDKLLPMTAEEGEDVEIISGEGSVETVLNEYLFAKIYYALASSFFAINYKRMAAMQQSTTNGEEIIEELTLKYNNQRQESITTELVDAEASLQGKRI